MAKQHFFSRMDWALALKNSVRKPEIMAFLPALTLAAFWLGGENWLLLIALGTPMIYVLFGAFNESFDAKTNDAPIVDGVCTRTQVLEALDRSLLHQTLEQKSSAALVIHLDDLDRLTQHHGRGMRGQLVAKVAERVISALRDRDLIGTLDNDRLVVGLIGARRLDLETVIQLSARLQSVISQPYSILGQRVLSTVSIGFCMIENAQRREGSAILEGAELAAEEAFRHGPGAIRSYAADMLQRRTSRLEMRDSLEFALDEGQIRAHFQPQVSTDTGEILGFEALARWYHPERGLIPPGEFLPLIEEACLTERLAEVMLHNALTAQQRWCNVGLKIPTVAVNFSASELRDPRLADKLKWELDRFGLTPDRLCVEILENVVAQNENDIIVANISALAQMGCGIDLDDFGTGHASITSIRRFAVKRLKIDRSFVSRIDEDREQQRMVSAILSMSERLGLETLAEGVETPGEHAMLAQLGCRAVQGFGVARPMPVDETISWIERYNAKLTAPPTWRKAVR